MYLHVNVVHNVFRCPVSFNVHYMYCTYIFAMHVKNMRIEMIALYIDDIDDYRLNSNYCAVN